MVKNRLKISIISITAVFVIASFCLIFNTNNTVNADSFSDQIDSLQKEINALNSEKKEISEQADTLANKVAELKNEEGRLQAEINLNNVKKDDLTAKINENTKKLDNQQKSLAKMLVDLHFEGDTDTLKILAGSKSISDYAEKTSRQDTAQKQVSISAKTIREIKKQLESQKLEIEQILGELDSKKGSLITIKNQQQQLLDETRGQESEYQKRISDTKAELARVEAARQAAMQANGGYYASGNVSGFAWRNHSGSLGCSGGYPADATWSNGGSVQHWGCNYGLDYGYDHWGMYNRECVSYAAWAASNKYNRYVPWGLGHAYMWEWNSARLGAVVNNTPAVGAVALMPRNSLSPYYGHVMVVDYITDDGWVGISQFNWIPAMYSTMEVYAPSVLYIHFPSK